MGKGLPAAACLLYVMLFSKIAAQDGAALCEGCAQHHCADYSADYVC